MLMAHTAVLNKLLRQYETLHAVNAEEGTPEARQRLDDVEYTLCIATGTKDVDAALIAARHRLPGARTHDDSLLAEEAAPGPAARDDALPSAG
ncbi:DUF5133 domain-containing protein [Streptomyces sp. WMMB 322]|uniref:DUF5133 domain-containing protein n=1 Tax=Streptomyces sp. WMMB 322 TaxID=1286821 RepID=UPI0006E3E5F0|nr:DUF5133 domain-containing protein [Streptomyces sp. WMMB 322]SCK48986.1 hypothetical protein H180DRAFT_04394 [Streptomyces sp. WMMB 322]